MPELPEVQTIVSDLNKKVIGRKITGVWFDAPKIIKKPKAAELEKQIKGLEIVSIKRRGKNILIYLNAEQGGNKNIREKTQKIPRHSAVKPAQHNSAILLIHQKMTGHLMVGKWIIKKNKPVSLLPGEFQEKVNDYIHIIFNLDNGSQLALSDLRKFAKVIFGEVKEVENMPDVAELGPDPLQKSFTLSKFKNIILVQKLGIKESLMKQKLISGIGNIYSDEILWMAKVHPLRASNSLSDGEVEKIYEAMHVILKKAIKLRGTSISDYRDTSGKAGKYADVRYVYRKEDAPCPRCKTSIKRIKVKSRSAHFCPSCQKG